MQCGAAPGFVVRRRSTRSTRLIRPRSRHRGWQFLQIQIRSTRRRYPLSPFVGTCHTGSNVTRHSDRQDGNDHRDDTNTDDEVVQALTRSVENTPRHVVQHRLITSDEAVSSQIGGYGAMTRRCLQPWLTITPRLPTSRGYGSVDLASQGHSQRSCENLQRHRACDRPPCHEGTTCHGTVLPAPPMLTIRPPRA